jgi:hypothetical protein
VGGLNNGLIDTFGERRDLKIKHGRGRPRELDEDCATGIV